MPAFLRLPPSLPLVHTQFCIFPLPLLGLRAHPGADCRVETRFSYFLPSSTFSFQVGLACTRLKLRLESNFSYACIKVAINIKWINGLVLRYGNQFLCLLNFQAHDRVRTLYLGSGFHVRAGVTRGRPRGRLHGLRTRARQIPFSLRRDFCVRTTELSSARSATRQRLGETILASVTLKVGDQLCCGIDFVHF